MGSKGGGRRGGSFQLNLNSLKQEIMFYVLNVDLRAAVNRVDFRND